MNIRFACPICEYPGRIDVPVRSEWQCPQCDHLLRITDDAVDPITPARKSVMWDGSPEPSGRVGRPVLPEHLTCRRNKVPACPICGNSELYKKKDFPHSLGMGILVLACLASTVTYWLYDQWLTWVILIGSAAFDGLLYLWVKDVIVCYRCQAHFRGVADNPEHKPFELTIHERYRQERLRREQLKG